MSARHVDNKCFAALRNQRHPFRGKAARMHWIQFYKTLKTEWANKQKLRGGAWDEWVGQKHRKKDLCGTALLRRYYIVKFNDGGLGELAPGKLQERSDRLDSNSQMRFGFPFLKNSGTKSFTTSGLQSALCKSRGRNASTTMDSFRTPLV